MTRWGRATSIVVAVLAVWAGPFRANADPPPPPAARYTIIELGGANVTGINNQGQVTGTSWTGGSSHAFLWEDGTMTDLGTLGGRYSFGFGINDKGQIVGGSERDANAGYNTEHAFMWQNGGMIDNDGAYWWSEAHGVNSAGVAVGQAEDNGVPAPVVIKEGTVTKLPAPCCISGGTDVPAGNALAINDAGQIVGYGDRVSLIGSVPLLWQDGAFTVLGSLGGQALGINATGQVVGWSRASRDPSDGPHAFLWQNGTMTDLGTLEGGTGSLAYGINSFGVVVGNAWPSGAFIYENGVMQDLNGLIPANSGWYLETARAINDAGQIVVDGWSASRTGGNHAFLLVPILPAVTTASLPDGVVSQGYRARLSAANGTAPYSWSLASGQLPPGLSLSPSGDISGTPTTQGSFTFTVQVTDSSNSSNTSYPLRIRIFPFSLSGFGTATIDGVWSPGEWSGAACADLTANTPGGGTTPARLCAMNDASNLYVSLRYERSAADAFDSLTLEFDNDNDGLAENGDDLVQFSPPFGFVDGFRATLPECTSSTAQAECALKDEDYGGSTDGSGAFQSDGISSVYEMSHPLNSGDAGHDFALHAGGGVGIFSFLRMIGVGAQYPQDYADTVFPGFRNYGRVMIVAMNAPTPNGRNVVVQPADSTTGATPMTMTFDRITGAGTTSVTASASGPTPAPGFEVGNPATYYDVTTTATFTGSVTVCLSSAGISFAGPPALFHFESGQWMDVTSFVDPVHHVVCGTVTSLSPFALFSRESRPPVANAGSDQTLTCAPRSGVTVTLDGSTSYDPDGNPLSYTWTGPFAQGGGVVTGMHPAVTLLPGTSTITLVVDNGHAASLPDQVRVTVVPDLTPPTLSVSLSPSVLWPANDRLVPITATIQVIDACDPHPDVRLVSITSTDAGQGDGHTAADIVGAEFGTDDRTFLLRAERSGRGTGRVYTVKYSATDKAGNVAEAMQVITVPHDRRPDERDEDLGGERPRADRDRSHQLDERD